MFLGLYSHLKIAYTNVDTNFSISENLTPNQVKDHLTYTCFFRYYTICYTHKVIKLLFASTYCWLKCLKINFWNLWNKVKETTLSSVHTISFMPVKLPNWFLHVKIIHAEKKKKSQHFRNFTINPGLNLFSQLPLYIYLRAVIIIHQLLHHQQQKMWAKPGNSARMAAL